MRRGGSCSGRGGGEGGGREPVIYVTKKGVTEVTSNCLDLRIMEENLKQS